MKAAPETRPEVGVLLQAWSTATIQTIKIRMAAMARVFNHIQDFSKRNWK